MSSLEKRHTGRHGGSHGHRKCSDGFSDTSSVGNLMDETDREVSNLTDRAFKSLCIGEDAIYNDLEVSTPTESHTAFVQDGQQKKDLKFSHQEKERSKSEVASTFQHSYQGTVQEQGLRNENLAYISNGETCQQKRSSSRVSSLIKAFGDTGGPEVHPCKHKDESWDKSALLSIQQELYEFSTYQNFQSYGNNHHPETSPHMTSSKKKFKSLNYTNFFCHSEFSPFQLWKDYNRFPFKQERVSEFRDFPRWYNSPLYKELTASQCISSSPFESQHLDQRQIEDIALIQRSRSTVIQKASAIEKRCESELASNCPPWKRNNNLVRNKLPSNRPSTVSPTNEKARRPDSSLLNCKNNTNAIQQQVRNVSSSDISSSSTPFNITQLLTPVIHKRQDTETSEILQLAHTPLIPDYSFQRESDRKSLPDVKQMRDFNSYKSKAPSLLFNIKDNRKRVKSTYSPPKFGLELSNNKQAIKLEDYESNALPNEKQHGQSVGLNLLGNCIISQQAAENTEYANRTHNKVPLRSNCGPSKQDLQDISVHPDKLCNKQIDRSKYEALIKSPHDNSSGNVDTGKSLDHSGSQIQNSFLTAHSAVPEKESYCRRKDADHQYHTEKNDTRKYSSGYTKPQVTKEKLSEQDIRPVVTPSKESFKGEIAALIEMDKQRKATAKQYLPSANETYTIKKESHVNNVNERTNQGSFPKENKVQESESGFQKYPSANVQSNYLKEKTVQNNSQNTAPPSKDVKQTICMEDKHELIEGGNTYQIYKYDSNKKWYIGTCDGGHNPDESSMPKENILQQPSKTSSTQNLKASYIPQQYTPNSIKTSHGNVVAHESAKPEEQKQEMDKKIHSSTNASTKSFQSTDSKFNINDILFIRDNEQAKRLREKCSPNASVPDPKLQHLTSPVPSDMYDDKATASKVKQEPTPSAQNITTDNMTRDSQITDNESLKIHSGVKDVLRKDRENDKMSRRSRGPSKQEILTSKLKAHAQKEISAIKEKELAKQSIPLRNHVKPSMTENNEKGQIHQEKKEITAERLNHLFQEITYSSLSFNNDNTNLKTESLLNSEVRISKRDRKSPCVAIDKYKNKEAVINVVNDKSKNQVTELPQDKVTVLERKKYPVQKNDQLHVQCNEKLSSMPSSYAPKELTSNNTVEDRTVSAKPLVSSSMSDTASKEKYVVTTENQTSNHPIINSTEDTKHLPSSIKQKDSPKPQTIVTPLTSQKPLQNILKQAEQLDTNKSQINDKHAANSNADIARQTDNNHNKESPGNAKQHEIIMSPISWTKSTYKKEGPASVMSTDVLTAITSTKQTKHTTNPIKDEEELKGKDNDHVSNNQETVPNKIIVPNVSHQVYCTSSPKDKDIKPQTDNTDKTNKGCFFQETNKDENKELKGHKVSNPNMEEDRNLYLLPKEVKIQAYEAPQDVLLLKPKVSDANDPNQMKTLDTLIETKSRIQQDKPNNSTNKKEIAKDQDEETEKTSTVDKHLKKDRTEGATVKSKVSEPSSTDNNRPGEMISTQNNNKHHVSSSDSDICADTVKPESENSLIHIASKDDCLQTEPIIYNICVSSPSNAIAEDEPVIFSISISSLCDTSVTQDSINQDKINAGQASLSQEQVEKKEQETFDNRDEKDKEAGKLLKEREQTQEGTSDGIKVEIQKERLENKSDSKKTEVLETKAETGMKTCDPQGSKSKAANRSTEVDSVGLAYERLLVKYGLRSSDAAVRSEQHQDGTHSYKKQNLTCAHSPKLQNSKDNDHQSREKSWVSVDNKPSKDLRTPYVSKEASESLKLRQNVKGFDRTLTEKYHTLDSNEEGMDGAVGEMESKADKKQLNDLDILVNKTAANFAAAPAVNLNMHSTVVSKPATTKDGVKLEENKQVRQEGQTVHTGEKKKKEERAVRKTIEDEVVQVKCKNDQQLLTGRNSGKISERSIPNNTSLHNLADFNSKTSVTVPEETKSKFRGLDKTVQDAPLVWTSQISSDQKSRTADLKLKCRTQEEHARDVVKPETLRTNPDLTKDNKDSIQNSKPDTYNKACLEQEQPKFTTPEETKHIRTEPTTAVYKQVKVSANCRDGEDVIINMSMAKNKDQEFLPVSRIHKHVPQNSVIKTHNLRATTDPPKNADDNATSLPSKIIDSTETIENEKLKSDEQKNRRKEITTVCNDNALGGLALNKTEKAAEFESIESVNKKETTSESHDCNKACNDQPARTRTGHARNDTGQRTEISANKDEQSTNVNVYQYHPIKGFIPEIKKNEDATVSPARSNPDMLLKKPDDNLIYTKDTQNERKVIKPEISALADYARLKVISEEADSNTEKDMLQKMNTNQKYKLSVEKPETLSSEQIKTSSMNKDENVSETTMPVYSNDKQNHRFSRDRIRSGILREHGCSAGDSSIPHPKPRSLAKNNDDGKRAVKNKDVSTAGHVESNRFTQLPEKHYGCQDSCKIPPSQNTHVAQNSVVESKSDTLPKLQQTSRKDGNKKCSSQSSTDSMHNRNINTQEDSPAYVVPPETTEEIQYYIVNALEKESKPKLTQELVPLGQNTDLKKLPEIPATGPRSNTSSPAMGKPTMFKIKDNTNKTTSVTKTVRPRFHRSLSQEPRVRSPNEGWWGADRNTCDQQREHHPKVSANSSASHAPSKVLYSPPNAKDLQSRNCLFSPGAKEVKSKMSEDVEGPAASTVITVGSTTSQEFDINKRYAFPRPESSCYERPESVCSERAESLCYERPESACSDMRSLSKPPVVPPKTEKALRRAQKLTTRRIKKAEIKMASDTQEQTETTPIRNVSSIPSSPMEHLVTHQPPTQTSHPISHYQIQPSYVSQAPSLMAHSFPITQRKLLQDPNSGQYFMVDMPMQVKTKTFFDPVTGKYLQLNVRQSPQSTQSTPVEVMGHSYVVYPSFLPMSVSVPSVPALRSSSQMSVPATLQEEQSNLEAGSKQSEPENYKTEDHRDVHQYNVPVYGTQEQKVHRGSNARMTPRNTHIITMSELEDFAVENS